jgi:HTH-type transcriptional regulator/antitoxin MqsA
MAESRSAAPVCSLTGMPMQRGFRPMTLRYMGAERTIDMPGWYCDQWAESIHDGEDMKVSDRALNRLKTLIKTGLPVGAPRERCGQFRRRRQGRDTG